MTNPVDDLGNLRVDFVWGNMPLQGDDFRGENTLDPALDNHAIATSGYSNYPAFIPNYLGDGDTDEEAVVPDILRMTRSDAQNALSAVGLNLSNAYHNPTMMHMISTGKTVRVYAYDTNASGQGGAEAYLVGLRAGDKVNVNDNGIHEFPQWVTVTAVNDDEGNSWFEFKTDTAIDPALDTDVSGAVWPDNTLGNLITVVRSYNPVGSIKNVGTNIHTRGWGD